VRTFPKANQGSSRGFFSCQVKCAFTVGHSLAMML